MTQFLVDRINRFITLYAHELVDLSLNSFFRFRKFGKVSRETGNSNLVCQIVLDSVRQYEVTVGQTLHQCRSTKAVCTVVGEVTFTDSEQTFDGGLQFVVYPDTTHCIVDSRINHHRVIIFHAIDFFCQFARINVGDFFIHIEEVAVTLKNNVDAQTVDSFGEIEEYGQTGVVYTETCVATFFSGTAGNVTRNQVTECRITAFQVIVAVFFRNITSFDFAFLKFHSIFFFLRNPDTTVVTERFRHQSQLRLLVTMYRNTSRVNLNVCRVSEYSTLAVARDSSCTVTTHSIGRQEVSVTITTGSDNYCVSGKAFQFTCYKIFSDDTAGTSVNDNHILHFITGIQFYSTCVYLTAQCGVSTQQQLLTGLAFSVESTGYLCATERTVVQCTAIFASERNTLCYTLVDDSVRHFSQTIYVCFTGTIVATFYSIVEQTVNRVTIILIILCSIDTTLCSDRVCTTGRILNTEIEYSETHFTK